MFLKNTIQGMGYFIFYIIQWCDYKKKNIVSNTYTYKAQYRLKFEYYRNQ